ncbi:MAG: HAD-IA family hydrolase [Actinomycetota bacterium]|nr:HAD-IA family hydrolase [Actinomycetota bacterium]
MEDIKGIFFDVGNTLLEPYPSFEAVCVEILGGFGHDISEEAIRLGSVVADRYYDERYRADDSFWTSEEAAREMWCEMYCRMLKEMGVDGDRKLIGETIYEEFGNGRRWKPYPDVIPVFEELKGRGLKLGIISNWDSRLEKICFDIGLYRYLQAILSSAVIGLRKPDPVIFEEGLSRLSIQASRALHVGDHYYADILGARSAGIQGVLIDRFGGEEKADVPTIHDLYGLLEVLAI